MAEDAITAAITGALDAAEGVTTDVSTGETTPVDDGADDGSTETTAETETTPEVDAAAVVEKQADKPVAQAVEKSDEDKELDALLEEAGVKAPKAGEKDNKIPYSRTRKIIANALKKQGITSKKTIDELTAKVNAAAERQGFYDRTDQMIANDPDRFMTSLAAMHPDKYRKYLTPAEKQEVKAEAAAAGDPEPQPDVQFEDKSVGYSPEQHKKLMAWNRREAKREAMAESKKEIDARMKPFEDERQAAALTAQRLPALRARIGALKETYGEALWNENEKAIQEAMTKADKEAQAGRGQFLSLEIIAQRVLVPKLMKTQNEMREGLLKEINARPKSASTTTPSTTKVDEAKSGPMKMEDVIKEALEAAGI